MKGATDLAIVGAIVGGVVLSLRYLQQPPTPLKAPVPDRAQRSPPRNPRIPQLEQPTRTPAIDAANPYSEGYDPAALLRDRRSLVEMFRNEPRDPLWAPVRERQMKAVVEDEVARVGGHLVWLECRSFTCQIVEEVPAARAKEMVAVPLGSATAEVEPQLSSHDPLSLRFERVVFFKPALRDPDAYPAFLAGAQDTAAAVWRAPRAKDE
jgi:hypothetical protein